MILRSLLLVSTGLGGIAAMPGVALAQAEQSAASGNQIVVTARKDEELLSDVPVSVTALTMAEIENASLDDIKDIANFTPGLVIEGYNSIPGRYDSTPFVRGVVFDSTDPLRQTVSVFVDGTYVSGGNQMLSFNDVARVEVIKGPQSAQFGRSTFAGAINYITVDPGSEFSGRIAGLAATRDEYLIQGSLEGGLGGDVLTARISGSYNFNGGHYTNSVVPDQKLGEEETWQANGIILLRPSDNIRSKLSGTYTRINDGHPASPLVDSTFNSGPFVAGGETFFVGTLPELPASAIGFNSGPTEFDAFITDARDRGVTFIIEPDRFGLDRKGYRLSWVTEVDLGDSLGLDVILGHSREKATSLVDTDQSPDAAYTLYAGRDFKDYQAEARLSGDLFNGFLDWSLGANYYKLDYVTNGAFGLQAFGQSSSFGNLGEFSYAFVDTTGIFTQLDFNLSDQVTLGFEGRYQWDQIDETIDGDPTTSVPGSPTTFKNFLPRATLTWEPNPDTLVYVSYSEGNLPGGFNSNFFDLTAGQVTELNQQFPGLTSTYGEETLVNYEIGWKQTFDNLDFTLSFYKMDRKDQVTRAVAQLTNPDFATDPTAPPIVTETFFVNGAASEIIGIELETNWSATDNLFFRGTLAYTNAEISGFPASGDSGDFEDVFLNDNGFIGQKAERYPEWQATISGTYEQPVSSDMDWYLRGDLVYVSSYFLSTPNLGQTPEVTDLRLRTGIRTGSLNVEIFATNVLNETAPITGNNYIDLSNATPLFSFGVDATAIGLRDKRQFGIRTSFAF